jgi:hypothetical protein
MQKRRGGPIEGLQAPGPRPEEQRVPDAAPLAQCPPEQEPVGCADRHRRCELMGECPSGGRAWWRVRGFSLACQALRPRAPGERHDGETNEDEEGDRPPLEEQLGDE